MNNLSREEMVEIAEGYSEMFIDLIYSEIEEIPNFFENRISAHNGLSVEGLRQEVLDSKDSVQQILQAIIVEHIKHFDRDDVEDYIEDIDNMMSVVSCPIAIADEFDEDGNPVSSVSVADVVLVCEGCKEDIFSISSYMREIDFE